MNTYIVKTMSCDDNKNKDKCIEQMQPSMLNKYEDKHNIYICSWNQNHDKVTKSSNKIMYKMTKII